MRAVKEFPKRGKGREQSFIHFPREDRSWCEEIYQQQKVGAMSFYWVIKGEEDGAR